MTEEGLTLSIEREFDSPIKSVWDAWTDQETVNRWSCPSPGKIVAGTAKLEVGGTLSILMEFPEGGQHHMSGAYRKIEPPGKLVFTHFWMRGDGSTSKETVITVRLEERGGNGTKMTFTQEGLPDRESFDGHKDGWESCFDKLRDLLAGK